MWLCSTMCLMNSSGFWPDCWARRIRCWDELVLLDADLLGLGDLVEQELRGHRVADALLELGLELVDGLLLVVEVLLHRHAGVRQLLLDLLAAAGELLGDDALGSGISAESSSCSSTASRAAAACSRRLPRSRRVATSSRSSSMVSNSEAVWANSSSSSGSSCSLTARQLDGDLDVLAGQVAAEQLGGEGRLLAGAQAAQGVVDALEHVAGADLVGVAADLAALDGLAVAGGLEVDGDDVAVLRRGARRP